MQGIPRTAKSVKTLEASGFELAMQNAKNNEAASTRKRFVCGLRFTETGWGLSYWASTYEIAAMK